MNAKTFRTTREVEEKFRPNRKRAGETDEQRIERLALEAVERIGEKFGKDIASRE